MALRVGRRVFVNHGCTLNDMGGIEIGDDTMLGPNVGLLTGGHPTAVAERRAGITVARSASARTSGSAPAPPSSAA